MYGIWWRLCPSSDVQYNGFLSVEVGSQNWQKIGRVWLLCKEVAVCSLIGMITGWLQGWLQGWLLCKEVALQSDWDDYRDWRACVSLQPPSSCPTQCHKMRWGAVHVFCIYFVKSSECWAVACAWQAAWHLWIFSATHKEWERRNMHDQSVSCNYLDAALAL